MAVKLNQTPDPTSPHQLIPYPYLRVEKGAGPYEIIITDTIGQIGGNPLTPVNPNDHNNEYFWTTQSVNGKQTITLTAKPNFSKIYL